MRILPTTAAQLDSDQRQNERTPKIQTTDDRNKNSKMEFNPGDVIHIQVTKADIKQDAGLKLEYRKDECYYVKSIGGLFKRRETPLIVGDKLLTFNSKI